MRVLVCGGRTYEDAEYVEYILDLLNPNTVIEGGAGGADWWAYQWAIDSFGVEHLQFKADWNTHGRAAGPIRNKQMLDEGKPDIVVAFPGGRGTANMVKQAKKAKIPVMSILQ